MKLIPFIALSKPLRGPDAARRFDAEGFAAHPQLETFVRLLVEDEFNDAPDLLHRWLAIPPLESFHFAVQVTRAADDGLFLHSRVVVQVRSCDGFDPSRDGVLRGGFLVNNTTDRQPEPMSKGDASHLLYAPHQRP